MRSIFFDSVSYTVSDIPVLIILILITLYLAEAMKCDAKIRWFCNLRKIKTNNNLHPMQSINLIFFYLRGIFIGYKIKNTQMQCALENSSGNLSVQIFSYFQSQNADCKLNWNRFANSTEIGKIYLIEIYASAGCQKCKRVRCRAHQMKMKGKCWRNRMAVALSSSSTMNGDADDAIRPSN